MQRESDLPDRLRIVHQLHDGQLELDHRTESWSERVDRGEHRDVALRLHPDGVGSPVVHDPDIASGAATVRGVRTEIVREQYEVGEDTRDIAETSGLAPADVLAALSHENRMRPLAA